MFQNTKDWDQHTALTVVDIIDSATNHMRKLLVFVNDEEIVSGMENATDLLITMRSAALAELGGIVHAESKGVKVTKKPAKKPKQKD